MTTSTIRSLESPAPPTVGADPDNHIHTVQFYTEDSFLLDELSRFIGSFLGAGDAAVVIATPAHHVGLAQRLQQNGFDVDLALSQGRYIALDAADTLSKFMVNGRPDPTLCIEVLSSFR